MSTKERDRLKVLHEVKRRHITQKQAGAELGLSERWIREVLLRVRRRGDEGLRHGLRGRASNRKTPEKVKRRVVELFREKKQAKLWHDYGPTLAAEELAADWMVISWESLRAMADGGQVVASEAEQCRARTPGNYFFVQYDTKPIWLNSCTYAMLCPSRYCYVGSFGGGVYLRQRMAWKSCRKSAVEMKMVVALAAS